MLTESGRLEPAVRFLIMLATLFGVIVGLFILAVVVRAVDTALFLSGLAAPFLFFVWWLTGVPWGPIRPE